MGESLQTPPSQLNDNERLPCPQCGYDLRANPAEHCSECGQIIDRASVGVSSFPWVQRRHAGRFRSYWKTVWLITVDSRRLRFETWKNQSLPDARSFQRITALLFAVTLTAICAGVMAVDRDLFVVPRPAPRPANWLDDLSVPWAAGANLLPVIPAMFFLFALQLTWGHQRLFRVKAAPQRMQERASAIGCYASGPFALLLPMVMFWGVWFGLLFYNVIPNPRGVGTMALALSPLLLALLIFPFAPWRILQWNLRVRNLGSEYSLLIGPLLIVSWLVDFVFFLGFLPWCIGLIWLAIDSSR